MCVAFQTTSIKYKKEMKYEIFCASCDTEADTKRQMPSIKKLNVKCIQDKKRKEKYKIRNEV